MPLGDGGHSGYCGAEGCDTVIVSEEGSRRKRLCEEHILECQRCERETHALRELETGEQVCEICRDTEEEPVSTVSPLLSD